MPPIPPIIPAKPRKRRKRRPQLPSAGPPPIVGPVLSSAYIEEDLFLFFDGYDITVDAFNPAAITVNDPATGSNYQASGASILSGIMVQITLEAIGPASGVQTILNAAANSGIIDPDSGEPWAGVSDLVLPFG